MASLISENQVRACAKINEVIRAIREAFARDFRATLRMPVRTQLDLGSSVLLLMPCHDPTLGAAGVKMVTVSPKTGVNATYLLLDPETGETLAIIEANYLTDVRTAATSAVATDLLARRDAETLGVFGCGRQARAHLTVLPHVRSFRRFLVCGSSTPSRATPKPARDGDPGSPRSDVKSFCASMKDEHGIEAEPVNAETCARESDVICTCTTSSEPLFDGRLLRSGTHLNMVGAFQTHTREVDDETVKRSRIVVDTYEGALAEAGDLLIPIRKGVINHEHIVSDLHELASEKKIVRTSPEDITLFKSVGCALEDLVTAKLVYEALSRA
jgi:ornithine cyclodeaminase/alanine dehydrogenase-like protein (mu-crystallin family)